MKIACYPFLQTQATHTLPPVMSVNPPAHISLWTLAIYDVRRDTFRCQLRKLRHHLNSP